jgi:hypothetical protein
MIGRNKKAINISQNAIAADIFIAFLFRPIIVNYQFSSRKLAVKFRHLNGE